MRISFQTLGMTGFIALVVILGFFGPYLVSILLLALLGLCWAFPQRPEDEDHSSGASKIGS